MDEKQVRKSGRIGNYIISILFILIGIFMLATIKLGEYGLISQYSLGPGFFPLCIAVLMIAIGMLLLVFTKRGLYDGEAQDLPRGANLKNFILMILITILGLLLIQTIGMVLTIALYFMSVSRFVCHKSWKESIISAVIATAVIFVVFKICFKVKFPSGIFGF